MAHIDITLQWLSDEALVGYDPGESFRAFARLWRRDSQDQPDQQLHHLVVLRIAFINRDKENEAQIEFDNSTRKAELQGLSICDPAGRRIEPVRQLHIRSTHAHNVHRIAPGASYVYDLVGERIGKWLCFPGAKYHLAEFGRYRVAFSYQGRSSNEEVVAFED